MRILITNDDGIHAPGLVTMHAIASEIAGADGEVWTVAPANEQSGVGHCISYARPTMMTEVGERRYAVEGSPADCVLAGIYKAMPERPDLVLSGVNRGNNAAENTLYSGTIGGAMEAALQGIPAIAMSQYFGPDNAKLDNPFDCSLAHGAATVRAILDAHVDTDAAYNTFYNVNFPPTSAAKCLGRRLASQGRRTGTNFSMAPQTSPTGREFLWIKGGDQHVPTADGTDAQTNLLGYISVTPIRADLTDYAAMDALKGKLDT